MMRPGVVSAVAVALLAAGLSPACADYSLLEAVPRPDAGFGTADGGGGEGLSPACDACLRRPVDGGAGCIAGCDADSRCKQAFTCTTYVRCLEGKSRSEAISCALPCGQAARIGSLDDPSGKRLLEVLDCGIANCGQACTLRP